MEATKVQKSVILDVDVGIDDAWAIFLALNNESKCNFKVKAITCVFGNSTVNNVGKNVLKVLNTVNRLDIPVYYGCGESLIKHRSSKDEQESLYYGEDGLSDIVTDKPEPDISLIKNEHAVEAMRKIIMENDNVHIIALGPLTNVALLLKMYPSVGDQIKEVTIMGGNRYGVGNITRAAEYNFYCDPEAACIVLQNVKCPVKLLPLETIQQSSSIEKEWRFNMLGLNDNKITKFLNPIEEKAFAGQDYWTPYDVYAVASFVTADIMKKTSEFHITVELSGFFTRGQVVIDHIGREKYKNVTVIEEIDVDKLKELLSITVAEAPK